MNQNDVHEERFGKRELEKEKKRETEIEKI